MVRHDQFCAISSSRNPHYANRTPPALTGRSGRAGGAGARGWPAGSSCSSGPYFPTCYSSRDRYRSSFKKDKSRVINEFIAATGHDHQPGIGLLAGPQPPARILVTPAPLR